MKRIDEMIQDTIDGVPCCQGHVLPFGAYMLSNGGINFSVNSADAKNEGRRIKGGTIRMVPRSLVVLIGEK